MSSLLPERRRVRPSVSWMLIILLCLLTLSAMLAKIPVTVKAQENADKGGEPIIFIAPGSAYRQTNFISDWPGVAFLQDPLLVNPWGISMTSTSPFWVANNGTSTTQLIRGDVGGAPVVLNVSPQTISIPGGLPTGTVANTTSDFVLPGPCSSPPCTARFLFSSITGNISGWNPNAPPPTPPATSSTTAVIAASQPGHMYTGLALANNGVGNFLYAADFANGTIDVYNSSFVLQAPAAFPFNPLLPPTPGETYHPYNIQNIGGSLYVTYAKIVGSDAVSGDGKGFVRKFNPNGVLIGIFAINGNSAIDPGFDVPLNAPWGVTIAPASFGLFSGALLVGNFGEGSPSINAFNPTTGLFLGSLQNEGGQPIVIDELWALQFGNGSAGGNVNTLYFTAGIGEKEHGLFGKLQQTTASATSLIQFATDDFTTGEGGDHIDITVTRAGNVSTAATVNYATFDESQVNHGSQKSDYELAAGTISFAPGESSKTFRVLIVNDLFFEGNEVVDLILSNPTGTGAGLGSPNTARLTILDNDAGVPASNPIDDPTLFVRQNYLDIFNREPDANAASFVSQITGCGSDASCINTKRVEVSTAFFNSPEYQGSGGLIARTYRAAFSSGVAGAGGPTDVLYGQFEIDIQALLKDVAIGSSGAAQLETNKGAYFAAFVTRPQFVTTHATTLTPTQYVDALIANAGFTPTAAERQAAIDEFGGAGNTADQAARARALRHIAENATYAQAVAKQVAIELGFYAYLRRDADTGTFNQYLNRLNAVSGDINRANTVRTFITSSEYRQRFGPDSDFQHNTAPVANDDTATTNTVTPVTINVLANDTDKEGDFLVVTSVTPGTGGTPTISSDGRSVIFTPATGFTGTATFQYTITDNGTNDIAFGLSNPLTDTATVTVTVVSGGTLQFSSPTFSVGEGAGRATITVTRSGDSAVAASVDYATVADPSVSDCATASGHASDRCDYDVALGTLNFGAGEATKSFEVFINDDGYAEGGETFNVALSNPKGTNFTLGTTSTATVTITDNDPASVSNPIADTAFFVHQHYVDFLNREPDPPGFTAWQNILNTCPLGNTTCDRVDVSSAFYRSQEFQVRGYFIYRFYRAALGRVPQLREFMMDLSRVSGFLTDAQLEANKVAFINDFMARTEFTTKYNPTLADHAAYVNLLEATAGVTLSNKQALITGLQGGTETRATVLRKVIESPEVATKFFNEAFVVEAYFGYLRRDPDALFQTWVQLLNMDNDRRTIVNGFVNSNEYVRRFGP